MSAASLSLPLCLFLCPSPSLLWRACVRACNMGQALWKRQQRSSAFKWIKTLAQSPGPACIGQTGCSLDEDLRLIISHAAFVFAATVVYWGTTKHYIQDCKHLEGHEQLSCEITVIHFKKKNTTFPQFFL